MAGPLRCMKDLQKLRKPYWNLPTPIDWTDLLSKRMVPLKFLLVVLERSSMIRKFLEQNISRLEHQQKFALF